jgi:hypothetical protein
LSAAHCVKPGQLNIVCFDAITTYKPQKLVPHPSWDDTTLANDIAVFVLDREVPVTPAIISRKTPAKGQTISLIGYGTTAETLGDAGTKRIATNTIKDLWATRFSYDGTGGGEGNTCKGDSGGPAFASIEGREVQVGVTSAGVKPCGTLGYSTRVDAYQTWIEQTANGDIYDPTASDTENPVVSITSPLNGTTLSSTLSTVSVSATDNVGVQDVVLVVDGAPGTRLTAAPYTFQVTLAQGSHTLKAVATDAAGNMGTAQITVKVSLDSVSTKPPNPGAFGAKCDDNTICVSQICGNFGTLTYCTEDCDPMGNPCPQGAECLPSGQPGRYVCGPPVWLNDFNGDLTLQGGCQLGHGAGAQAGTVLALLFGLFVAIRLSRARRG